MFFFYINQPKKFNTFNIFPLKFFYLIGTHNGLWKGNQYFKCPNKHGLFTHACNVGFSGINRKTKNSYKTKADTGKYPYMNKIMLFLLRYLNIFQLPTFRNLLFSIKNKQI